MRKLFSWKKLVLIALCVAMVFTFVACGEKTNTGGNVVDNPTFNQEFGQLQSDPTTALSKVAAALFAERSDKNKTNFGFNGDLKLKLGNNELVDINVDLRLSVDRKDASGSKFSLVINRKGIDGVEKTKMLLGAYFDGVELKVDSRGTNGHFYVVDTDIIYLVNLIASAINQTPIGDNMQEVNKYIKTLFPILGASMVKAGAMDVYEKYVAETNSSKITSTIYLKKTIMYVNRFLSGNGDIKGDLYNTIVGMVGEEKIGNIIETLNKIAKFVPDNATVDVSLGVVGANDNYSIVDGSFKVGFSKLEGSVNAVELSMDDQADYVKKPIDPPSEEEIDRAKLGAVNFDVGLDVRITKGKVSFEDIDKALGGILNGFVQGLEQDIDFSKNYIEVPDNTGTGLRISFAFQLDIKDNNKTNILAEIYFDSNGNEKNDDGKSLLQIYYVGKDQAFYIDLSGFGKASTLPNKLKIAKDLNGNAINLTQMFSDFIQKMITESGKLDFSTVISMVAGVFGKNEAPVTEEQVQTINQKMLNEYAIPTITNSQGGTSIDVMAIVKIILKELNWDYNDNGAFYGFSLEISAKMFRELFAQMGMDISLLKGAYLGIHVTPEEGFVIDLDVTVNAETYTANGEEESVANDFPTMKLGLKVAIDAFKAFDESRLPIDRFDKDWQSIELKSKVDENGKLDIINSLLASLSGKKVYLSASAQFDLHVDQSNGKINIGSSLNSSIGGALGAALADLQLMTGAIDVTYTLNLVANVDLGSFVNLNTTEDVMTIIRKVIGDQELSITLTANYGPYGGQKDEEILAMLLSKGALYLDAENIGIPKTKIELESLFEMVEGLIKKPGNNTPPSTPVATANDPNATIKTVIAILSNVDVIKIMEGEIAIALNSAFLNVLIPMFTNKGTTGQAGDTTTGTIDLTMSKIELGIDFNSDIFNKDKDFESVFNKMTIYANLGTDIDGTKVDLSVKIGGINLGIVDVSTNEDLTVRKAFFKTRSEDDFVNPFETSLLNFALTGTFRLTGDGEFTFNNKPLSGEIGEMLSTLALVIGMDNLNANITMKFEAAIDLANFESNNTQIALTLKNSSNELIAGVYVYDKYVYVNIPGLIKPFRLEFDIVSLIYDLLQGNIKLPGKNEGNTPSGAVTTAEGDVTQADVLRSLISVSTKTANIELSSNMIKGLVSALVGSMTKGDGVNPPKIDPQLGDEIISLVQTLPFDIMFIGHVSHEHDGVGPDTLLDNLEVDLNIYVGEKLVEAYNRGDDLKLPQNGVVGLGINLSGLHIGYIDNNTKIDVIKDALANYRYDDLGKIESVTNIDIKNILVDTKASLEFDGYLSITSNGVDIGSDTNLDNNIMIQLKEIMNTLPDLLINIGALQAGTADLMKLYFHLAVSADIGAILDGNFNDAIELSLGIYRSKFVDYETSDKDKIISVVVLSGKNSGTKGVTLYVDAKGLAAEGTNNDILSGKIKLENIDLNSLFGNLGISDAATATADDFNTTMVKMNGVIGIINSALSAISISNNGLSVTLGENLIGVIVNLITKNDGSVNSGALPLTAGDIKLILKQYENNGFTYEPGLYANLGFKDKTDSDTAIALGIGLYDLNIAFAKRSGTFLHEKEFDTSTYVSVQDLKQISVSLNLGLDVDMKEGVHNLNLLNKYGKFIGTIQSALALTEEGGKIVIDQNGAAKDLHLNVLIQGQVGLADVNATQIKLLVTSHPTQEDRKANLNGKVVVAIYLYKDEIYIQSDILNITNLKIPSLGISQYISDTIKNVLGGVTGAQSTAYATASEGLDFLIGDRKAEITVSKVFLSTLIKYLVPAESAGLVDAVIDNLFQGLKLEIDLRTMSATINLDAILNEKPGATGGLINATLAMQGLEISVFEKDFISQQEKELIATFEEAKTNAFIEFGASASIEREAITNDKQLSPDNIFGQLAGIVDHLDMLDPSIRGTINKILRSLYINIMSDKTAADNGMYVKLNVLVQVNLDWNSWQSLDLNKSSFRLLITDTGNNPVLDVYLIGANDTMYIDAPLLGTNTKLALSGINLIEMYEQSKNPEGNTVSELATATAGVDMQKILGIIDGVIGEIGFTQDGMSIGFASKALVAIASALGLVPSIDSGLVDAIGSLVQTLPDTSAGSGVYIEYAKEVNNKTAPVVGLRYGLDGVGMIDINLNHYALGVINNFSTADPNVLPFNDKDKAGLEKMRDYTKHFGDEYSNLSKMQNIQLDIMGELNVGLESNQTNPLDLSSMVQGVLGSILSLAPLKEIGAKIYSDVKGEEKLNFRVQANLDIAYIVENLQLGLTIYKKGSTTDALIEVFYDKGSLYVNAPEYLGDKALKIANLLGMFSGNGGALSAATAGGETLPPETIKHAAALEIIFGQEFVGIHVTSGIFAILVQLLQGTDIVLTEDMFKCLENQLDIGITLGSSNVDEHLSLPELYASVSIKFGPVMMGLKASEPKVTIGSKESIVPKRIIDNSAHFSEVTFRVQAEGRLGISADKTTLDLNALLKEFGINEVLDFGVDIANPNDPTKKPINLHLGLELDAEICLGDISKCNIALRLNAYRNEYSFSTSNPNPQEKIGEILSLYMTKNSLYIDLKNNIIDLTEVHINTDALTEIVDAIKLSMSGGNTQTPVQSGAMSTAEATAKETAKEQLILSNLIQLNFNGVGTADGEGVFSDLGSITAEIGGVVIQNVLKMLGLNHLANAGLAAVIKIDTPTGTNSNFGFGVNIVTGANSSLINNLGLYVWLGNIKLVKQIDNTEESRTSSLLPPSDLVQSAFELSDLYKQFINVDLTASLSMMTSTVEPPTDTDQDPTDNNLIMKDLITEFFKGFVPWMPDFLAQLEIIGQASGMTYEDFMSSHSIRLQANINLGMLINNKTCTVCKKDFNSSDTIYQTKKVCPHCGASNEQIEDKGFYLDDIDIGIELLRNTKAELATVSETLLGLYIRDSQIAFYGKPFGLNNFVIEKDAVESIADTIKYIIGQGTSAGASNGALSTATGATGNAGTGASVDIVGLIGKLVRQITISMYAIRIAVGENILSYIPELMASLGVQGFPEFGYPSINDNNYIQIGLIQNEKVDLSLLLNFDMFGLNTQVAIEDVGLGLGAKKNIEMPKEFYNADTGEFIVSDSDKLDGTNSILNVNVEAELRIDINKADTNLSALLGGLLGDLKVGYKNDKTITKDFLLRINAQINIADYSLVLGVEIVEQYADGVTPATTVLGLYYDSTDSTAYVKSTILPNLKITGLELDVLLGKIMGQSVAEATAGASNGIRPIINPDAIKENSNSPSVKVTMAMQQYFAVAISGELINQIINGIDQINSVPVLPDFEVALRFGKSTKDSPFAITLQIGLGKNDLKDTEQNPRGFLIDLTGCLYLGPVYYDEVSGKMSGGTFVNFLTKDKANLPENKIITNDMKEYPTLLNIAFDANGNVKPEIKAETVELGVTMFLNLGHEQGNYNFSSLLAGIFGENVEFTAMVEALEKRQANLSIDVKAQINVNNLIMNALSGMGVSLDGTNLQLSIKKEEPDSSDPNATIWKDVLQLTFKGGAGKNGNDAIYLKLYGAGRQNLTDHKNTEDIAIVVDTINIMDIVNKATGKSDALSTASSTTALAEFINTIIKEVHIHEVTSDTSEKYIRVDVNFAAHIFDDVIKLVTILMSDTANATTEQIMNTIAKLNLPDVTRGGLYLAFNQSKVGLGVGLDMQLNNSVNIALGLEINALGIVKDETGMIQPDGLVADYKSVSDLQVGVHFEGYVEMSNKNTSEPMSIGGIITTILGLLNVNVGDVDFNVETKSTEYYGLTMDGYINTKDFILDTAGNPLTKDSKIKLSLKKQNLTSQGTSSGERTLLDIYLDAATSSVYVDLTGMNLPKLALTGLDIGKLLGKLISPYLGGEASKDTLNATATANDGSLMSANKLSAMLYLTLGVDETSLRFNADLINAILQLVLGYLSTANPNNQIINAISGLTLPDFGTVTLGSYKDEAGVDHLEVRINRVAGVVDDNYLALGVKNAGWKVNPANDPSLSVTNPADYGTIYDLQNGLGLQQVYVDTTITLSLDFSDPSATDASSFTRYISRLLALLIDKSTDETAINKYKVLIVSESGANKILEYQLRIKGILDITDIFGGSNLSIELWKMDKVHTAADDRYNVMLLGAYLRTDTANGLPTLFLDLNNLGLPRLKLVGIDGLLGGLGLSSATAQSNVIGTGNYDAVSQARYDLQNRVIIEDNKVKLQINQGFLYGILGAALPQVFKNGYIDLGSMLLPLPNIAGVELTVDLANGLQQLKLDAYLEKETTNKLGIDIFLKELDIAGGKKAFAPNKIDWSQVGDKYSNVKGEDYFNTFGAVHISSSFKTDMINEIIESIDPNVAIQYNKRGDSLYREMRIGGNESTMYEYCDDKNSWNFARMGQSWTKILLSRGDGNQAQSLMLQIMAQSGADEVSAADIKVNLGADGTIHANIDKIIPTTESLSGLIPIISIQAGLNIGNMIFGQENSVRYHDPNVSSLALGTSGVATAMGDASAHLGEIFANLDISKFLRGIEIRIYTDTEKNGGYAQTEIQVKVDTATIDELFKTVNWLLVSEVFGAGSPADENKTMQEANDPKQMYWTLKDFIRRTINGTDGTMGNTLVNDVITPNSGLLQYPDTHLANVVGSLLPLPSFNLNPIDTFKMETTSDQDGNATELVRGELTITLGFNPNEAGLVGALKSINAQFGNNYGFGTYDNGNITQAQHAVGDQNGKHNLGWLELNITANNKNDALLGTKAVSTINGYDRGENVLQNLSEQYIPSGSGTPTSGANTGVTITDPVKSVEEIREKIIHGNGLPTKVNVSYLDGTSTGGAINKETETMVSIVWDDSRINLNANGSGDSYLYGWVQNKMIAKIKVTVESKYLLKDITSFEMPETKEQNAITIQKIDGLGNLVDGYGNANIEIIMESYQTKNLPSIIYVQQGDEPIPWVYSTNAVKRIIYREITAAGLPGKEYDSETEEGLTVLWDAERQEYVNVEEVGWRGDWYISKDLKVPCQGKLEWDTSKLSWSVLNPYVINTTVGNGTVGMKLITGKMDDFVLEGIKVKVERTLDDKAIIDGLNAVFGTSSKDMLEIDIVDMPNFIEKFAEISRAVTGNGVTTYEGTGLEINFGGYNLHIDPSEISFDLTNIYQWMNDGGNKYGGDVLILPVKITRTINNPADISGRETNVLNVDVKVKIKMLELVEVRLKQEVTRNGYTSREAMQIALNPYGDILRQLQKLFDPKPNVKYVMEGVYRSTNGMLDNFKYVEITPDSFDMNSTVRVKFDLASIYGTYTYKGGNAYMRVYVGDSKLGYLQSILPVSISGRILQGLTVVNIDEVNVLDANTLSNIGKALELNLEFLKVGADLDGNANNVQIVWYDKDKLMEAAKTGKKDLRIDAIIGYKQNGETKLNNYLNQKVVLNIRNVKQIYGMSLVRFAGFPINKGADGKYMLPANVNTNVGDLVYRYYDETGSKQATIKDVTLTGNFNEKTAHYSIGLFDFDIQVNDKITRVTNFFTVDELGNKTDVDRVFSQEADGTLVVKYSFVEKLPNKLVMELTVPTFDEKGNVNGQTLVYLDVNLLGTASLKEATIQYGVHTIKVKVTK